VTSILTATINPAVDLTVTVDRVVPTEKLRCSSPVRDPGGGGINVARVVHRLGGTVTAAYAAGGSTGTMLRALVDSEQVTNRVLTLLGDTRENLTVEEHCSGNQFRFVLPGPTLAEGEWCEFLDLVRSACTGVQFLVASGSLAPGVPDDFYARCSRIARQAGARFVLDCAGAPMAAALDEHVHMIKPSLHEFEAIIGSNLLDVAACAEAARSLISAGRVDVVALSLGDQGALLVTPDLTLQASAVKVVPCSTVGAGDSFLGGLLWGLTAGYAIEHALRYGMAAAAATLLQPGTRLCQPDDVHRLVQEVKVEPMAGTQVTKPLLLEPDEAAPTR
jgi:6-phosphofructokinase 2